MNNLTHRAVSRQLKAMAAERYDVGILTEREGMILRKDLSSESVLKSVPYLKHENGRGAAIYIRPSKSLGLVLLDDVTTDAIEKMKREDLNPACTIETSPNNYQVWLRLIQNQGMQPLPAALICMTLQILAKRYRADINSADWRHFGRLAGFTNRKKAYQTDKGYPYVLIHEDHGGLAKAGREVLIEGKRSLALEHPKTATAQPTTRQNLNYYARVRGILARNSHQSWSANPDKSILDHMITKEMIREGHTDKEIIALLGQRKDLDTKHTREDYLARTIRAARRNLGLEEINKES